MSLNIIPFEPQYAEAFKMLNLTWINKYFYVEEEDKKLLENCEKFIIDPGGFIFFVELENQIVGCFAFMKLNNTVFELGKMAVDPNFQGLQIGQKLLAFALDFARKENWKKIQLYSSSKLPSALHIYEKYGFNKVELEKNLPYIRSDVKMELVL